MAPHQTRASCFRLRMRRPEIAREWRGKFSSFNLLPPAQPFIQEYYPDQHNLLLTARPWGRVGQKAPAADMSIDHRGLDIAMAQE